MLTEEPTAVCFCFLKIALFVFICFTFFPLNILLVNIFERTCTGIMWNCRDRTHSEGTSYRVALKAEVVGTLLQKMS